MGIQIRELMDWVRRRKFFAGVLVVFTLAIGILIGTLISGRALATRTQASNGATLLAIPDPVSLSGTFSAIAGKLEPTVVNISTTQVIDRPKGHQKRKQGDPFESRTPTVVMGGLRYSAIMWAGIVMLVRRRFIAGETAQVVTRLGTAWISSKMVEKTLPNVNIRITLAFNNLLEAGRFGRLGF